jgi:Ca-activated chloride channel family protein
VTLAAPWFLLVALAIPLAVLAQRAARRRRRRFAVRFPAAATVAAVAGAAPWWRRLLAPALLAAAVALLALALARPQATVAVPVERAAVTLIADTSRSMLAEDVDPSRLEAARRAAHAFLDRIPEQLQVGVVAFSSEPHTTLDPTLDHAQVRAVLDSLVADGGTATGDALQAGLQRLQARRGEGGRRAPAAMILLSDGAATEGQDPVEVARRAGEARIPIYTVALGTPDGTVPGGPFRPPVPVPPDPETLRDIARESGGQAFEVDDAGELDAVYERLGSQIGTRPERREVSAPFAGAALAFLLVGAGLGLRWRGRLP